MGSNFFGEPLYNDEQIDHQRKKNLCFFKSCIVIFNSRGAGGVVIPNRIGGAFSHCCIPFSLNINKI